MEHAYARSSAIWKQSAMHNNLQNSVSYVVLQTTTQHSFVYAYESLGSPCFYATNVPKVNNIHHNKACVVYISTIILQICKKKHVKSSTFMEYRSKLFHDWLLKSVHFKKAVARISFLSKLWYFQYKSKQKVPQFSKKRDSRNCLLKMNGH